MPITIYSNTKHEFRVCKIRREKHGTKTKDNYFTQFKLKNEWLNHILIP